MQTQEPKLTADQMWALCPEPVKVRLMLIAAECDRACNIHTVFPFDRIHQAGIVCEEAGEVMKAALQFKYEGGKEREIAKEVIQTGSSALRMLMHFPEGYLMPEEEKWITEMDTQVIPLVPKQ